MSFVDCKRDEFDDFDDTLRMLNPSYPTLFDCECGKRVETIAYVAKGLNIVALFHGVCKHCKDELILVRNEELIED